PLLKAQRQQWTAGRLNGTNEIIGVMAEIERMRKEAGLDNGVREINVKIVEGYHGIANVTCPHCQKRSRHEISNRPFDQPESRPAKESTHEAVTPGAVPSTDDQDPAPQPAKVVPLTTRPGISPSAFHDQRFASGEQPPLKRLQRGS